MPTIRTEDMEDAKAVCAVAVGGGMVMTTEYSRVAEAGDSESEEEQGLASFSNEVARLPEVAKLGLVTEQVAEVIRGIGMLYFEVAVTAKRPSVIDTDSELASEQIRSDTILTEIMQCADVRREAAVIVLAGIARVVHAKTRGGRSIILGPIGELVPKNERSEGYRLHFKDFSAEQYKSFLY